MMSALGSRVRRLAPLAVLVAAGGCFATRADVRVVQSDVASMRTELLRSDAEMREQLAQAVRLLTIATDSIRVMSGLTVSMQGDVRGESRSIREQLLQIQQLLGQSQAQLNRLRAEMEQRNTLPPGQIPPADAPPTTPPPGGAARDTSTVSQTRALGPSQLYTSGIDQFRRGSWTTARTLFQELITNYPDSDHAPDAQYHIAESHASERNMSAADAAYAAVVQTFPDSPRAPTALYKRAQLAAKQGNNTRARELANEVIRRYPRSDEAELVPDFIKSLR
jgi:tol-pal system protein YbgF